MPRRRSHTEILGAMRFGLVGGAATLTHLLGAQLAFALGLSPLFANCAGFTAAFVVGLLGHHYFTFSGVARFFTALRRYAVIALAGFAVNNVILLWLVSGGWVDPRLSLAVAVLVVPAGTFLASRFWGFVAPAP